MTEPTELAADRIEHVAALTTDLCNAVLHAHLAGHGVTNEQVHALAKAARLLQDEQRPWPPILEQVLHDLTAVSPAGDFRETLADEPISEAASMKYEPPEADRGMARFFNAIKRKKD